LVAITVQFKQNSTLNMDWYNFETSADGVHMAVIMEPSMWHVSAMPWKAAYGPQVKKTRKQWAELNKMEFWKGKTTNIWKGTPQPFNLTILTSPNLSSIIKQLKLKQSIFTDIFKNKASTIIILTGQNRPIQQNRYSSTTKYNATTKIINYNKWTLISYYN
jgi:hypothetical protein